MKLLWFLVPLVCTGFVLAPSCASNSGSSIRAVRDGSPTDAPRDQFYSTNDVSMGDALVQPILDPLCGQPALCNPDDPTACANFFTGVPAETGGLGGASAGSTLGSGAGATKLTVSGSGGTGTLAAAGAGGSGGGSIIASGGAAGALGASGAAGATGAAGAAGAAGSTAAPDSGAEGGPVDASADFVVPPLDSGLIDASGARFACRVSPGATGPVASCSASGAGQPNDPCITSADCQPGLACAVGDQGVARCLPFCCRGTEISCGPGTYCATQPLSGSDGGTTIMVPVCVKADNCSLTPCSGTTTCSCLDGTACSVVRADGTTSCTIPGTQLAGESCACAPGESCACAPGTICSQATSTCLKLCMVSSSTNTTECGPTGRCQSAANLPMGWGVCVTSN